MGLNCTDIFAYVKCFSVLYFSFHLDPSGTYTEYDAKAIGVIVGRVVICLCH